MCAFFVKFYARGIWLILRIYEKMPLTAEAVWDTVDSVMLKS